MLTGCSDIDDEITNIGYGRLFSPTELAARIVNKTSVRLTWNAVKGADGYNIEVFANGDMSFDGAPVLSFNNITEIPFIIEGLEGESDYSIRVRAVGSATAESKWAAVTVKTDAEQIFLPVDPDELKATEVTLRWTPGQTGTEIVITPGNIKHVVTAQEITNGAATITGLIGETTYTAKLMNGAKTRGTLTFTTLIDLGDATGVYPEDDLIAILDAAKNGDAFVLFPGTYNLGAYDITKSLKISGYKSNDKPVIYGQLTCSSSVNSLELKSITFRGDETPSAMLGQFFNILVGCNLKTLSINDCDIYNYANQLIYNNTSGTIGDIIITNSLIHDIEGSGGDGIDFRGSTLGSFKVENTTFYNGFRTFLRMQAKSGPISFTNCTFYRIANYDNSNNHGLFRVTDGTTFEVKNCIFVETGNATTSVTTAGNFCRQSSNMKATTSYATNVYYSCYQLWVGLYTSPSACSASEVNPQFKNPAQGDFTVQNIDVTAGDPRWLK
jgi:hypothetical protein